MSLKTIYTALITALCYCCSCSEKHPKSSDSDSVSTDNTLTVAQAKKYVKNYEPRSIDIDSIYPAGTDPQPANKKTQDTRAVWFGIERLKALVNKIEAEGGDGIRFYYAAYDSVYKGKTNAHTPIKPYWNHNTLIMVSTRDSSGIHKDYYTDFKLNGKFKGFIITATPENKGEMCPPPVDCNGTGATLISR